jgi:hypothetical protein
VKDTAPIYFNSSGRDISGYIEKGKKVTVLKSDNYCSKYYVKYDDNRFGYVQEKYIEKPRKETGPTENLKIQMATLIKGGHLENYFWGNELIECRVFYSAGQLINSIVDGIQKNHNLSDELKIQISGILRNINSKIIWHASLDISDINELGKYLGECLIGLKSLIDRTADKVLFPVKSNFPLVDCFLYYKGQVLPLSMKYGRGANAQLFSILNRFSDEFFDNDLKRSRIYSLIQSNNEYKNQRHAVYDFVLNRAMGRNVDPVRVFELAQQNRIEGDLQTICNYIYDTCDKKKIIDLLPDSLTTYCAQCAANLLNRCQLTIPVITKYIESIALDQYHLDNKEWLNGNIAFKVKRADASNFKVYYGKSVMKDIRAARGLLTFKFQ